MKTNIFKVREKKNKKIVIEEETYKNPLLLFLKRHKNFILMLFITILVCSLLVSIGVVFSLFQGSNDYDITYIEGGSVIDSNPDIDKDDVKNELLGEVSRSEGVILLTETFMSDAGDVISYYSDGSTIIVQSNGKIYRVSSRNDGSYGVSKKGKIYDDAKKILVESTTTTLSDGTTITNYTDGSAKIELKEQTIFVRDSNNIKLSNGISFYNTNPSGVALTYEKIKTGNSTYNQFTDKTHLVREGDKKVLINKNTSISNAGVINYDAYNTYEVLSEKKYDDGNTIIHFSNGSAIIVDEKDRVTYVKKSGDILLKSKKIYEIIPNDYGFSRSTTKCGNGTKVVYFDNGAAVIINADGTRDYILDNDEIVYDNNKNIISTFDKFNEISKKETTDGEIVFNFSNGKSQVIKANGSSYIIDTSSLTFKPNGEIADDPTDNIPGHNGVTPNPGEGIYISEAENKYNDFKNVEKTTFIIKNNNSKRKKFKITIQEVANYGKYNTSRLEPKFVKFQATIGDNYVPETKLSDNTWIDSDNVVNYTLYEGVIGAKSKENITISLYVDYETLDNSYQDKGFIGTIKVYIDDELIS